MNPHRSARSQMTLPGEDHPYSDACAQKGCAPCFAEWRLRCHCGSGLYKFELKDGHGIFLTYACEKCEESKLGKFRPDIMERYEADEPIEDPDEGHDSRRNGDWDE